MSLNPNAKPFSFNVGASSFTPGGGAPEPAQQQETSSTAAATNNPISSSSVQSTPTKSSWDEEEATLSPSNPSILQSPNTQLLTAPTPNPTPAKSNESQPIASNINLEKVSAAVKELQLDEDEARELREAEEEDKKAAATSKSPTGPSVAGTGVGGKNQSSASFHEKKSHDGREHINIVFIGHVDAGKCWKKGSKLIRSNGELINVENIQIGDELIGPDSQSRTVLSIHPGYGSLYCIHPTEESGQSDMIVTGNHILIMKINEKPQLINSKQIMYWEMNTQKNQPIQRIIEFSSEIEAEQELYKLQQQWCDLEFESTVNEFRVMNSIIQKQAKMSRSSAIQFQSSPNNLNSILSQYLAEITITSQLIQLTAQLLGQTLNNILNQQMILDWENLSATSFSTLLQHYNLSISQQSKTIPQSLLQDSLEVRQAILTSFIQSTQSHSQTYQLSFTEQSMAESVQFLARSLGLHVSHLESNKLHGYQFTISSSTNNLFNFTVSRVEDGEYYGISVTGDQRVLMSDFTISHNSTISGQILLQTGQVDERTIQKYEREAKEKNRESWYLAYILDTSEEERAKGKTVEVGRAHFQTSKKRYTLLDAPGHKNYVPNMIGGASQADVGVLVISARKGEFEAGFDRGGQTREHAMLAKTLGIQKLIVLVNKMDEPQVKWGKDRYDEIEGKLSPFLKKCGFNLKTDVYYIPASGYTGVNIKEAATAGLCDWYTAGKSLFQVLDDLPPMQRDDKAPLRLPIMARYKDMGALFCLGKLEAGTLVKDTNLLLMPTKIMVQCTGITVEETEVDAAKPGENVLVKIKGIEEEDVQEGFVLSYPDAPCKRSKYFECQVAVLDLLEHKPLITVGYTAVIHVHVLAAECTITHLLSVIDKKTGEPGKTKPKFLKSNDFATIRIQTEQTIAIEEFKACAALGRFTLRDEGKTIAIGKITKIKEE